MPSPHVDDEKGQKKLWYIRRGKTEGKGGEKRNRKTEKGKSHL